MSFNVRNRSFLKLDDFTAQEIKFLLHLSAELGKDIEEKYGLNALEVTDSTSEAHF